jgi:phage-related protein
MDALGPINEVINGLRGVEEESGSFDTQTHSVFYNFCKGIGDIGYDVTHFDEIVEGACDEIGGFFSDMGKTFADIGSDIGKTLEDVGKFFEELGKGIDETIRNVIDWFRDLPQNIMNALGDLGQLLWGAGEDIINGFWDGLKDTFERVKDWVRGIGDWIRDNKGPKQYDLGLLVPNGGWIMQGLADGMRDAFPLIEDTVSDIAGLMSVGMPDISLASAGRAQQSLPPVNVYMTYNAGEDARELVADMVGQLRRYGYTMGGRR